MIGFGHDRMFPICTDEPANNGEAGSQLRHACAEHLHQGRGSGDENPRIPQPPVRQKSMGLVSRWFLDKPAHFADGGLRAGALRTARHDPAIVGLRMCRLNCKKDGLVAPVRFDVVGYLGHRPDQMLVGGLMK